jgi:DNA-binding CsgD family transcriptional regulator
MQAGAGAGRIALLTGEAGIGKSRLTSELKATARAAGDDPEPLIVQGNCFEPDRTLPYAPLLDLLDGLIAGRSTAQIADLIGSAAAELARLLPAIGQAVPDRAPVPESDPEQEKRRLFQALAQVLVRLAAPAPLVLIVEDIHWCDDTSLEFFVYLARRIAAAQLLVVFTYRSDEVHPALAHFLAMLDRERIATEYALTRLTVPEAEEMLRAIFGPAVRLRREMVETIYTLTEGNPLFIEELAKSVGGTADDPVLLTDAPQIPRSVRDAVQRRSAQLDPAARDLLRVAAVAGRRFDFALLHAVTGHDEATLLRTIAQLVAAQLVVEESADHFAFRHALTQQAVYSEILARERRALHSTIATMIARIYPETPDVHLADLAYHANAAGDWEQALAYSRRVGERALALHAPRAAVEHFTRALGAAWQLTQSPPAALYRSRGLAYGTLGEFAQARSDHEAALFIARDVADSRAEWQSLKDLGDLWAGRDYERAGVYFREAATLARDIGDPVVHARSLNRLANWLINTGEPDESLRVHTEALRIFTEARDRHGMAETYDLLGMANGIAGATRESVQHYERAIALLREDGDAQLLSSSLASKALYASPSLSDVTLCPGGDPDGATRELAEALRLAQQTGWLAGEAYAYWSAAVTEASYGSLAPALRHGIHALRIAREIEHAQWTTAAHWSLGQVSISLLRADQAIEHLGEGLLLASALGSAWWHGHISASLAHAHLLRNDPRSAASVLTGARSAGEEPRIMPERRIVWMWGEIALAQRDPATALRIADRLVSSTPGAVSEGVIPWLMKLRGESLTALRRFDEAAHTLDAAQRGAAQQYARPLLWQVQRARGRLLHRWKRDEAAAKAYADARATVTSLAETLDDPALRDQFLAVALATMPPERQPSARQRAAESYGGLTQRERDVAVHIAQGLSNRDIADALFVSERTVTTHVTNILGKLGLTSRAQIARWADDRELRERSGQRKEYEIETPRQRM